MIHSLVCVILPISLPPAYKPSFFDNPNYTVEDDKVAPEEGNCTVEDDTVAHKEALPSDNNTKRWLAWETAAHLFLYFLEIAAVLAYAASMYNYWSFEGKAYKRAFQEFWDELGKWMHLNKLFKLPLNWAWLALIFVGIYLVVLVLTRYYSNRKSHPKEKKYELPEEGCFTSCCAVLKSSLNGCLKCCCKCCEKDKPTFTFNAEEEVLKLVSRELVQEQTVEKSMIPKYRKEDIIVCGTVENVEMQPLLPETRTEGTSKKLLTEGNDQRKEPDEPSATGGRGGIDKRDGETRNILPIAEGEENNETLHSVPINNSEGVSTCSHDTKVASGPYSEKPATEIEVKTPVSPIKDVKDDKAPTERERNRKDVNDGSVESSFGGTDQVGEEAAKKECDLQKQPEDLKTVLAQTKTVKWGEKEVCHKCDIVSVEIVT